MIERHLRNGVMTEVYRARREGSGRERFEVRRFTLVASSDALRAVRRELERIEALKLPAIPSLVEVIDDPVGLLVVTTTATEGSTSLRMTLDAAGTLEPAECVRIVRVVAGVLDVLHGASPQVLHRRLSPDTITLVGASREVRVEECGLAQALVDAGLVNARVALQARQYLSPDELLQRPSPRGDIFALASVAFECLTGRPAFLGATEASLSAAILRGVRPSAHALRAEVPIAVDAVLSRAWSADASKGYLSAAALADALAVAVGAPAPSANLAPRVVPASGSPPAGTPVLSASELNLMKSTILGVGAPSRPPPTAPRAKPNESERQALSEPLPVAPGRPRIVGGRPQMPTQKVEVPRIHPPGTERVGDEAERPTFPPARLPPAAPAPRAAPSDRPAAADLFNIADIDAFDIPMSSEAQPSSRPPAAPPPPRPVAEGRTSSMPPPVPRVPSRSPTILRSSVPPAVAIAPEPEAPSSEVTFEMDAEIPASVVENEGIDSWESPPAPSRPPSMPALPKVSAPAPAPPVEQLTDERSSVEEIDPAPDADLEIGAEPARDPEPSLPVIQIPVDPTPPPTFAMTPTVSPVPEVHAPMPAPAAPVFAPAAPIEAPPPAMSRFEPVVSSPPSAFVPPPPPPPASLARWWIVGGAIVAAAAIVTGGQIYLAKLRRAETPRPVPAVVVPTPVVTPPPPTATVDAAAVLAVVDAAVAATVDAPSMAAADASTAVVADDVVAVADAPAAVDAGSRPVLVVDASAPTPAAAAVAWDARIFGEGNDPPRTHPRRRDMSRLEETLEPEVRRCVGPGSSRHVRMSVIYAGSTGQPREIRIVGAFAQPPAGPCLEALLRAHPVPPFTDDEFDSNFVFSTSDEEEE